MKTTKLAKELPRHKSYPRYVSVPSVLGDKPTNKVRLTSGRFISTQRWNELAQIHETFEAQFAAAKTEADTKELQDRAQYAQIMNAAARTGLEMDAAANGMTLEQYLITLVK